MTLAYTATQLERGLVTWDSPDILHWSAWQGRQLDTARAPSAAAVRRLSAIEDWYLWREAIEDPAAGHECIQPDSLLDDLQRADELIEAWGLAARPAAGAEGALLGRLRRRVEARRRQLQVADRLGWRDASGVLDADIWCLGFDEIGRADRRALESLGVRVGGPRAADGAGDSCGRPGRIVAATDPDAEAQLIADWCRAHLQRDPRARLLVLMARRSAYEFPLRAALSERLDGESILQAGATEPLFAIEGGTPLLEFPLVATARLWLRAVTGRLQFSDYAALLRSAYLGAGGVDSRTRLESWLRRQQVTALDAADAEQLRLRAVTALEGAAVACLGLLHQLHAGVGGRHPPAVWAQRWVDWLQAAGWPGEFPLGSREQQVRQRFEQLLGEIAQLGDVAGACTAGQALDLLDGWLRRAAFEPASGDVPVTVGSDLRDPLLRYDGIWVCGLTAQDWPPAAVANPFIDAAGLLAAGSDAGTASGALRRAEEALQSWARSTSDLVCSWPLREGDALLLPSPLLPVGAEDRHALSPQPSPWRSPAAAREVYGREPALPWPAGRTARGGVSILEQQSRCPFQGFALGRLQSAMLEQPQAGISAQVHGTILHEALQRIWHALGDSAALLARQATLDVLVRDCVDQALRNAREQSSVRLPPAVWEIEAARCERLVLGLLKLELQRESFAVVATEDALGLSAHGVELRLKLDRLDRLEDGSHVLIDYKSGKPRRFEPLAERPQAPQLLAYATALQLPLSAVASAHLNVEGSGWLGAADTNERLPRVKAAGLDDGGWPALLQRWRGQIDALLAQFAAGEARVDPLPKACDRCHLSGLCRIAESELALDEGAENDSADDGAVA